MTISVIIVSWNAKAFLLKCLESVLAQELPHAVEVIVVDNASSDGSPDAVRAQFPTVKLICNADNYGFSKANNIGIKASRGEYLFLINSDAVASPGSFAKMISYMTEHPRIGMLGPRIVGANGQMQRSCMAYPSLSNALFRALALDSWFPHSKLFGSQLLTYWDHDETRTVDVINGCFWVLRRSAVERVGLLDERFFIYGEDVDWCKRFTQAKWEIVFYSDVEALHYGGASSSNAPVRFYLEMQRANYQYWLKHHSRPAAMTFLLINLLHHGSRAVGETVAIPFRRANRAVSAHKIARNVASLKWGVAALATFLSSARLEQSRTA